jgi:hypothetical protein
MAERGARVAREVFGSEAATRALISVYASLTARGAPIAPGPRHGGADTDALRISS